MPDHKLTLYISNPCYFCYKVQKFLTHENISIPTKNITQDEDARNELIEIGGRKQTPCLVIDGKAMYESDDIIVWLSPHILFSKMVAAGRLP